MLFIKTQLLRQRQGKKNKPNETNKKTKDIGDLPLAGYGEAPSSGMDLIVSVSTFQILTCVRITYRTC